MHSDFSLKTNKNQGSPIKTIKSHDSILVPLLGRGVFTAGFAPARPYSTNDLIVLHPLGIFIFIFFIFSEKIPFAVIELKSQRVRRLHGYL